MPMGLDEPLPCPFCGAVPKKMSAANAIQYAIPRRNLLALLEYGARGGWLSRHRALESKGKCGDGKSSNRNKRGDRK